jgi:Domain of unknown function (DUF4352)
VKIVLALSVVALGIVACGGEQTIKTVPETVTVTEEAPAEETTTEAEPEESTEAQVGDSITLHGSDAELEVRITVTQIIDPAPPKDEFFTPEGGARWVAVELRLVNVGTTVYDDSPGNGASLIDNKDQSYTETFAETSACRYIGTGLKIAAGDRRVGCLVFEVPERVKPRKFQMTLDSGFGPETGEWVL